MKNKLDIFFRRFCDSVNNFYDIPEIVLFLKTEAERKRKIYPFWRKKVRFSFASYKKQRISNKDLKSIKIRSTENILQYFYHDDHLTKNKQLTTENLQKIIPKELDFLSISYFKMKFMDIFEFFLADILPFEKKSLKLEQTPIIVFRDIFLTLSYKIAPSEIHAFQQVQNRYKLDEKLEKIIEYLFSCLIHIFGMLVGEIIPENFQIELITGKTILADTNKIEFIVTVRQKERYLKDFFLNSHIFQFSELFPQIPNAFKNKLKMQKDLLYLLALKRYFNLIPYLTALLARIQKKCIALGHITPLLDILNFTFSRVEDSIFTTEELLLNTTNNQTSYKKKREFLLQLFTFCNKNAVLYGTFQSNNRSQLQEQFRLFFLYNLQYFGEGFEYAYESDNLFFPTLFKNRIQKLKAKYKQLSSYFKIFEQFLQSAFALSSNPAFKHVFIQIFRCNVDEINEVFFSAFLVSLNKRLYQKIDEYNFNNQDNMTSYSEVVEYLIKTINFSVNTIFLEEDPLKASQNFRDSLSRYSPKNIALRSLELLFFKEIPLSDNNWMNYNLSRNKETVINLFQDYFKIPKDYFFSDKKLLHISMKDLFSLESDLILEEWFFDVIISPFLAFIDIIWNKIQMKGERISQYDIISEIYQYFSKSIINPLVLDNLEIMSEKLSDPFFKIYNSSKEAS